MSESATVPWLRQALQASNCDSRAQAAVQGLQDALLDIANAAVRGADSDEIYKRARGALMEANDPHK